MPPRRSTRESITPHRLGFEPEADTPLPTIENETIEELLNNLGILHESERESIIQGLQESEDEFEPATESLVPDISERSGPTA